MSITTNDLAKICGVSRTTVLRALNDTGRINADTKEMILQKAKEHGYRPDLLARGLARGRTYIIGVVVLDVKNRYFAQMLSMISTEARKRGYGVNIMLHDNDRELEKEQISRLVDYRVDGIILSSVNKGDEYVSFLNEQNIPIISVDNKIAEGFSFIGIRQKEAMRTATKQAIVRGYQKLVLVCPPISEDTLENIYVHMERYIGFSECVQENNIESVEYLLDWTYLDKVEACVDKNKKTAFICSADEFALAIMNKLRKKKLVPQKDYGIVGFDNIDILELFSPKLCTISNSVEEVAVTAVNALMALIDKEELSSADDVITEFLPYQFIEGETL